MQYRREQELMLGALHEYGMRQVRAHMGVQVREPTAWLGNLRKTVSEPKFLGLFELTLI